MPRAGQRPSRALNQQGFRYRRGRRWSKDLILQILDEPAVAGTYYWGRHGPHGRLRDRSEWLALEVTPLIEQARFDLVRRLRAARAPKARPGRARDRPSLLRGLVYCAKCGANYQIESSGKRTASGEYKYRYYNCRSTCRIGVEACMGGRIPMGELDEVVLVHLARAVCTDVRCRALVRAMTSSAFSVGNDGESAQLERTLDDLHSRIEVWEKLFSGSAMHRDIAIRKLDELGQYRRELEMKLRRREANAGQPDPAGIFDPRDVQRAWMQLITEGGSVAMNYLHLLVKHIEINGDHVEIIARDIFNQS